ncbi:hypothetical protein EJB05_15524 [Eragrostis curvula]|uniref:Uncharacterized protein n=1 Tax=Eragrostis curvula TaxID=38414 RepID=A0A5J9VZT2_9POAL|nr:hypothetical protein EJB05_15524 [Eragrostis curvula]
MRQASRQHGQRRTQLRVAGQSTRVRSALSSLEPPLACSNLAAAARAGMSACGLCWMENAAALG